jgi:hypothetical protein
MSYEIGNLTHLIEFNRIHILCLSSSRPHKAERPNPLGPPLQWGLAWVSNSTLVGWNFSACCSEFSSVERQGAPFLHRVFVVHIQQNSRLFINPSVGSPPVNPGPFQKSRVVEATSSIRLPHLQFVIACRLLSLPFGPHDVHHYHVQITLTRPPSLASGG